MNKTLSTAVLSLFLQPVFAQKGIEKMIQAEKDFAAYSVAHSTKEAFQQFIDSNSIMFDKGEPVKAVEYWNKREKRPGILDWHPQYAEISASGDFGYTSGPWTFRTGANDSVVARGQYSTVWHLDQNGKWKFLADLGIDNTQPGSPEEKIITAPKEPETYFGNLHTLAAAESAFNQEFHNNREKTYQRWLADESILSRNGSLPGHDKTGRDLLIRETPGDMLFNSLGWGISAVPDMGYTYGATTVNGKTENYLRIWRREKKGWRIALEVLRY